MHVALADSSVDTAADEQHPKPTGAPSARWPSDREAQFRLGLAGAVAFGAVVRFVYLFHGAPSMVRGDGYDYHLSALRLADGLGYTSALWDVGAQSAHHPPGWVTVLAGVTALGGRSMWQHQVTGLAIGLAVIALAGLVGRRYVGRRVGVIAAFAAAIYPGFWLLDVQILSEPLGLVVVGLLMLVLADLWERPSAVRAVLAGALAGTLGLVRSEQLALLAIAIAPLLLLNRRIAVKRRVAYTGAAALVAVLLIAPWTVHNLGRFEEPVVLSTNAGPTLLSGNCPAGGTYGGEMLGSYHVACTIFQAQANPDLDSSELDAEFRDAAFRNMRENVDRLPQTVAARYGRLVGVFRPTQTVDLVATWLGSAHWPVWAWVTSYWVLVPLAVYGSVLLRRSRRFQWPLVAPLVIMVLVTAVSFGDLRYHVGADLGVVVLAAVAVDALVRRRWKPARA